MSTYSVHFFASKTRAQHHNVLEVVFVATYSHYHRPIQLFRMFLLTKPTL